MKQGTIAAIVAATFIGGFAAGRLSAPEAGPVSQPAATPPAMPAMAPQAMPAGHPPTDAPAGDALAGTIAEVIQVPNYTYLRLSTAQGDQWAAVSTDQSVQVGQAVRIAGATEMAGFTSTTLKRTFDRIWFGQLAQAGAAPAPHPAAPAMTPQATDDALKALAQGKAPLTLRVADVFAERMSLAGQTVQVRGTVKKATSVQGLTYVHLQDGSGIPGTSDDLTVLTTAAYKVGDEATLSGRVAVDKDLGLGVVYPVVLEAAGSGAH